MSFSQKLILQFFGLIRSRYCTYLVTSISLTSFWALLAALALRSARLFLVSFTVCLKPSHMEVVRRPSFVYEPFAPGDTHYGV